MAPPSGWKIADTTALKAIVADNRSDGYVRLVEADVNGNFAWYAYRSASTDTDDGDLVLEPDDGLGRWHKVAAGTSSNSGANFDAGLILTFSSAPSTDTGEMALYASDDEEGGELKYRRQSNGTECSVATLDLPQIWNKTHQHTVYTLGVTGGEGAITVPGDESNIFYLSLTSAADGELLGAPLPAIDGDYHFLIYQTAGSKTIDFNVEYLFETTPTMPASAGSALRVDCINISGTLYCTYTTYTA